MRSFAEGGVERCCELAKKDVFYQSVATPCLNDHLIHPQDVQVKRGLSDVCAQIVLAGSGRPDVLRSLNTSARSVTKWNKACREKTSEVDQVHQLNKRLQTILSCGK